MVAVPLEQIFKITRRSLALLVAAFLWAASTALVQAQTSDRVHIRSGAGTLIPTPRDTQNYEKFPLDVSEFISGTLVIEIEMGAGTCMGSFDLFGDWQVIPTRGRPTESLSGSYDQSPRSKPRLSYRFSKPGKYVFCADGSWLSRPGETNTYKFSAYVVGGQRLNTPKSTPIELIGATLSKRDVIAITFKARTDFDKPVRFNIYRSKRQKITSDDRDSLLLKSVNVAPPYVRGQEYKSEISGVPAGFGIDKPFIVVSVVGTDEQIYFRKWYLGVVVHGYAGHWIDVGSKGNTEAWVEKMADTLKNKSGYDDVIPHKWINESAAKEPRMAIEAAFKLASDIQKYRERKSKEHVGDVVDINIIGHSRGTVVASQTLLALKGKIENTYVNLVLLDSHPANKHSDTLCSPNDKIDYKPYKMVVDFQAIADDPEIVIPDDCGVSSIILIWQKTPQSAFPFGEVFIKNGYLNLWGIGDQDGRITNLSGVKIIPFDLTGRDLNGTVIGHEEVHVFFQEILSKMKAAS